MASGERTMPTSYQYDVPRDRLKRLMGACDSAKVEELDQAIKAALGVR